MFLLSDLSSKQLFAFPELAKELLCAAIDQPWVREVPLSAFERVNASYVGATGQQRHDDVVWRLQRPAEGDLYLLIEFQSRPDPRMPERMHAYTALLAEDLAKQGKPHDLQILPIVLYSGRARWKVPTAITTLPAGQAGLETVESQFRYLVVDRHSIQDRANIVHTLLRLDQVSYKYDDLAALLKELNLWLQRQSNLQLENTVWTVVKPVLRSVLPERDLPPGTGLEEGIKMLDQNIRTYVDYLELQTARKERIKGEWKGRRRGKQLGHATGYREGVQEGGQKGFREGIKVGIQEGIKEVIQEGIQEGRKEERQEIIRALLQRRGYQLSAAANEQLERADAATLTSWLEKLLANEMPPELKLS